MIYIGWYLTHWVALVGVASQSISKELDCKFRTKNVKVIGVATSGAISLEQLFLALELSIGVDKVSSAYDHVPVRNKIWQSI